MDLFTHVVFAYLLSFVIWGPTNPQYIAAGALAGGLPDADVLLFPLARRFGIVRHHGITHSILGVTVVAAVGSFLLPYLPYFPRASTLLYFVAMVIGGLSHVFLDGFTHFAVHPLLPFSWKGFRLDADVAINAFMLTLTSVTIIVLYSEIGRVPLNLWIETAWILTLIYGGYLLMRGFARWRAGIARRTEGYSGVAPSTLPWVWTLLDVKDAPDRYSIRYRRYRFGETGRSPERQMTVAKVPSTTGPVLTSQEALERTYADAMKKNGWLARRPHFGQAALQGDSFEVLWYMIEGSGSRRTMGVRGTINRSTGEAQLRSGFFQPPVSETT